MERRARFLGLTALILAVVVLASFWGPWAYERFVLRSVEKTHLLYSPTLEQFIYREEILGPIPPEARALAEDHHAGIAYRDEAGHWYSRVEFEKNLPFIYYKNMELWGLMPLSLGGKTFDSAAIRAERQVTELKGYEVASRPVAPNLHFLLDDQPPTAGLVLPVEVVRLTSDGLELVNADTNAVDRVMSQAFTKALKDAGARWPLKGFFAGETILKPANAGAFLIDARGRVFHLRRRAGQPSALDTGVPEEFGAFYVALSESRRGEYWGLVVGRGGKLALLMKDYRLMPLPVRDYDPFRDDVKLVCDPLYRTLLWDDGVTIHGVVMDRAYRVLRRYDHPMACGADGPAKRWGRRLLPLKLSLPLDGRRAMPRFEVRW